MEAQGKDTCPPSLCPARIEQTVKDLAAARKGGDLQGEALALESLGFDYLLASETAKAFQAAREALHAWRKHGNGRGAAHALTLMALCIKSRQGARESLPTELSN